MNGDGYQDVVSANFGSNSTTLYINSLTINHTLPAGYPSAASSAGWTGVTVDSSQNGPISVFATDINGNGNQDLVVAVFNANKVNWYNNVAGNGFNWTLNNATLTASGPRSVIATDLTGAGTEDIIVANFNNGQVVWLQETCTTNQPSSSSSHVVGWATATGVIGFLLLLWLLLIIALATRDFVVHRKKRALEKKKKLAKAAQAKAEASEMEQLHAEL